LRGQNAKFATDFKVWYALADATDDFTILLAEFLYGAFASYE